MKKNQILKLEMIRREIISEIINIQQNQKLNTNTAFRFIEHTIDLTHKELIDLVIDAAILDKRPALVAIERFPTPFAA